MLGKLWGKKFVRFCAVGLVNTTLDFTILNVLVFKAHKSAVAANLVSVSIGICVSYCLNHTIVFRHGKLTLLGFLRFVVVTGSSVLVIQSVIIYLTKPLYHDVLTHIFNGSGVQNALSLNLAKATAVIIGLGWNYVLYHTVVFKKQDNVNESGVDLVL